MHISPSQSGKRRAWPEHLRISFSHNARGAAPLELPRQSTVAISVIVGAMFVIFAAVLWNQIAEQDFSNIRSVFDLMSALFGLFWIIGWGIGVVILGLLTILAMFYRQSAWLGNGRLVTVGHLGPLHVIGEYDLAQMRNLHVEPDEGNAANARVRFDYGDSEAGVGDAMPTAAADKLVAAILRVAPTTITAPSTEAIPEPSPPTKPEPVHRKQDTADQSFVTLSLLVLLAANVIPLFGVLFREWGLGEVMVLFWAESAVIGFYTVLKMAVAGKWATLFFGPFFIAHFGGFMAIHFIFVYQFFVRGLNASGADPGALESLRTLFVPLWSALLALFISHGVSFVANFLHRGEYERQTALTLMAAPYRRIYVMHITIIFGGWMVMLFDEPLLALVLLVMLKIGTDLYSHRRERLAALDN